MQIIIFYGEIIRYYYWQAKFLLYACIASRFLIYLLSVNGLQKKHENVQPTPVLLIILEAIISIAQSIFSQNLYEAFYERNHIYLLFVMCSIHLFAQKDKNRIEASVVGFFNGLSLVNADTLKFYVTPDFHLLEDGQVWNMDTLISKLMPLKNSKIERINTFKFIRTEQSGNMAWVSYNNSAEFRLGENKQIMRWLESAVLIKRKGGWKIQLLHSTKLK